MSNDSTIQLLNNTVIEIMDTTLRDGEQTSGVSFSAHEKLSIARMLLDELHVDRIEVASARVSEGEFAAVRQIVHWAAKVGYLERIEVLGFVDGGISLQWIREAGVKVVNLLTKGSLLHCREQLRKTPEEHIVDIKATIEQARAMGLKVNVYLEDWSNGMLSSPDYVFSLMDALHDVEGISRFMLPDTLGVLNPYNTYDYCRTMLKRYPSLHFDFHAHNDYDLAAANTYSAAKAGVKGVHVTVNGLGERAGNCALSSALAVLHDQLKVKTNINEEKVNRVSRIVEGFSGVIIPPNKPIIGDSVFTQCAGIHADGDSKKNLYYNDLLPERFGRTREYALGKTSGKANIKKNLEMLGIELTDEEMRKLTERVVELGDKKEWLTPEELPYIISDVLKYNVTEERVKLLNYSLSLAQGLKPVATVRLSINGHEYEESATGGGQYDAFVKAIRHIYKYELKRQFPMLVNYQVTIPPGGRTDAFVQTVITWEYDNEEFKTRGLNADQSVAAIQATIKMLNRIEQ